MHSRWNEQDAAAFVDRYGAAHGEALALRVYSSQLIGQDPALVLHGGGNTSVKTTVRDLLGEERSVICVKGSGWDLASIEPAGLPALELPSMLGLRRLEALSDEEMVNQLRTRLLRADAPTPSVETLLHAFLPEVFVDHSHADAILVLGNQPDGTARLAEALGEDVPILEWIMPGFPLAKAVAEVYEAHPGCRGVALRKHGLFTFGPDARTSYERMIELVDRAEQAIATGMGGDSTARARMLVPGPDLEPAEQRRAHLATCLPLLRGALCRAEDGGSHVVADLRDADDLCAMTAAEGAAALVATPPLTPDHVLRTKGPYLFLARPQWQDPEGLRAAVAEYRAAYRQYFANCAAHADRPLTMLDPSPRVVALEGLGMVAFGADGKAARIAADIAERTLRGKAQSVELGRYEALTPAELFEMEYWSLEQAKLGKKRPPLLGGQVALVTGAAGAIGHGICDALLGAGAHVFACDLDGEGLERVASLLREQHGGAGDRLAVAVTDVTDAASVAAAFDACALRFGGTDILVPNAGVAHVSSLEDMDLARFQKVVDVNLTGTLTVLQAGARVFAAQGSGGSVVIQASKNVFAPGARFGAYSASKAGATQLGKIAAQELAPHGVRVNMVNADAVFGDEVPSGLWAEVGPDRMRARGLEPDQLRAYYRDRSLLKQTVTPAHVGAAVLFFASQATPTTGATLPVDGGIPEAFPR